MLITIDLSHLPSLTLVGGAQVNTYMHIHKHTQALISLLFVSCLKSNIAIAYLWIYTMKTFILQLFSITALLLHVPIDVLYDVFNYKKHWFMFEHRSQSTNVLEKEASFDKVLF